MAEQSYIELIDEECRKSYDYEILTAKRNCLEKYIGKSWYAFAKDRKLRAGDILKCTVTNPPDRMFVELADRCWNHSVCCHFVEFGKFWLSGLVGYLGFCMPEIRILGFWYWISLVLTCSVSSKCNECCTAKDKLHVLNSIILLLYWYYFCIAISIKIYVITIVLL